MRGKIKNIEHNENRSILTLDNIAGVYKNNYLKN